MEFKHFVGIDISKMTFDVAIGQESELVHFEFDNSNPGISKFISELVSRQAFRGNTLICLEHTGHYIDRITRILHGEGYFVWVVQPLVLHYFSADLNRLKNDKTDAKKLMSYARSFSELAERYIPESGPQAQLRKLERLRRQLVGLGQRIQNMIASNRD